MSFRSWVEKNKTTSKLFDLIPPVFTSSLRFVEAKTARMSSSRSPLGHLSTPLVSLLSFLPAHYLLPNAALDHSTHRLEVTSDTTISCGELSGARMMSGYAHIDNGSMYWLYFPAADDNVKGLTIHHNGGPASSMDYPFLGASYLSWTLCPIDHGLAIGLIVAEN